MYDAVVVGARCAGAATALLLARKGYKVLLVDRSSFPSNLAFSTHYIHQSGAALLKRWGLLDKVAASNCPPITTLYFDFGTFILTGSPPPADGVRNSRSGEGRIGSSRKSSHRDRSRRDAFNCRPCRTGRGVQHERTPGRTLFLLLERCADEGL